VSGLVSWDRERDRGGRRRRERERKRERKDEKERERERRGEGGEGRAASRGAPAPETPRATRNQPESIRFRAKNIFFHRNFRLSLRLLRLKLGCARIGRQNWQQIAWEGHQKQKLRKQFMPCTMRVESDEFDNPQKKIQKKLIQELEKN